jgi:hypothetical protein
LLVMLKLFVLFALCVSAAAEVLIVADEFPAMEVVAAKLKQDAQISSRLVSQKELPASLNQFEAVVVYIHGALGSNAENAFIEYTLNGGKLVALHHSISSGKRKNANWFNFLGVSLPEGEVGKGGYKWIEEITWELVNLNPNHFIMTNRVTYPAQIAYTNSASSAHTKLPGFTLHDSEVYLNHVHTEPRTVLMGFRYVDTKTGSVYMQDRAGWIKRAGKGSIVYLMPGHTVEDLKDAAYGQIVANAVMYRPPAD